MNKNSKGFADLLVIIVLAIITIGGIGYWAYKNGQIRFTRSQNNINAPSPTDLTEKDINPIPYTVLPTLLEQPQNIQGNCPSKFYFFESDDFSLCFPAGSDYYPQTIPFSVVDRKQNNVVHFGHSNITLDVTPYSWETDEDEIYSCYGDCNPPKCWYTKENITVSNFPAVRKVFRQVIGNNCGKVTEIKTIVNYGKKYHFLLNTIIAYGEDETPSLDINQFKIIEQSLKIKL